ncbi:hypothetical protein GCM10009665_17350 [Kitasatospora nipponensis]|uniref:Uncharacterized protein n=1 Tax=Kitasatospora nipponensis TaxID=258049 RepID=A0ABN1W1I9_9ACTN
MEGKHRLIRQTSRWARFAQVTVRGAAAAEPEVLLGLNLFRWRDESYGHLAGTSRTDDQQIEVEALEGAWYALMQLPEEARGVRVSVVEIVTSPVDTGPGDVKFAAAHAVWQAVGRQPRQEPWIGEDGTPVFP